MQKNYKKAMEEIRLSDSDRARIQIGRAHV